MNCAAIENSHSYDDVQWFSLLRTVDNYQPVGRFKTIRTNILKLYFTMISRRFRYCQSIVSHIVDRQKYRSLAVLCCSFQQLQRRASFTARRAIDIKTRNRSIRIRDSTFNNRTVVRRLLSSNQTRRRQPPAHHGHRSNGCTHRRRHRA